jgi:lysine-N-methylase
MPGIRVLCDGAGGCCRAYASVVFLPADVHAAELAVPARGADAATRFLPVHGSAPTVTRAVGLIDGACTFLDAAGRCTIHARVGFDNKPLGCRWYPARVCDDGIALRVAPAIECLCVARPNAEGDPLVPEGIVVAGDLPVGISVESVPASVALADGRVVERRAALAIADAIAEAAAPADPIGWLWTVADALERGAFDARACAPMPAEALAEASRRWARIAAERRAAEGVWRSAKDPVCVRLQTLATAAALTSSPTAAKAVLASPPDDPALEAYVVRAGMWGRSWLVGPALADVLREHAVAFALARAVAAFVPEGADGTLRGAPLAAVLAVRRTCF